MRLENLYPNFGKACAEEQAAFISAYRLRRAEDMAKPSTYAKRTSVNKSKIDVSLTSEELALMKMLGLKKKDMMLLRTSTEVIEESTNDINLFADGAFEEVDE